jgi:hypothetical protein
MFATNNTAGEDKNPSVFGTGNFSRSSGPLIGSQSIDRETIQTAGVLLQTGDCSKLVEAIRILDNTKLIELESYEWITPDMILLVYGPGEGIETQ